MAALRPMHEPASREGRFGHSKLETTALYTKVSTWTIHAVAGPLDRLMALMEGKMPPG
ncbi:hypothetical protein [Tianweitania sediminis]|uniref:hypothetical protein n=1 Tax=Tianweitania sediminis TaxID=1502156 RepID=UPI001FD7C8BF|nr:hypothetical protein [Tianweitania sediminis]